MLILYKFSSKMQYLLQFSLVFSFFKIKLILLSLLLDAMKFEKRYLGNILLTFNHLLENIDKFFS